MKLGHQNNPIFVILSLLSKTLKWFLSPRSKSFLNDSFYGNDKFIFYEKCEIFNDTLSLYVLVNYNNFMVNSFVNSRSLRKTRQGISISSQKECIEFGQKMS